MHGAHADVDEGAHVVAGEAADEVVEFRGSRTYTKEEGDFDEEDDECADSVTVLASILYVCIPMFSRCVHLQTHYTKRDTTNRRKDVGDT